MIVEYRIEFKTLSRISLLLIAAPMVLLVAFGLTAFFDPFGEGSYELATSIFHGDFSRIGEFFGYLAIIATLYGLSGGLIYGIVYESLFKNNQQVFINTVDRTVSVHLKRPLSEENHATYVFAETNIALKKKNETVSERGEIWISLPDKRNPVKLVEIFDTLDCYAEYQKLLNIGLPGKIEKNPLA